MRWKVKPKPYKGENRIKRKFLWLPIKIESEIRWLEYARIHQTHHIVGSGQFRDRYWSNDYFMANSKV